MQVYVVRTLNDTGREQKALLVGQRHFGAGGTGGKFSVPRARKGPNETYRECAQRVVQEAFGTECPDPPLKLTWVGADSKDVALRDFTIAWEDLQVGSMFDLPGQRSFRAFSWWTEAEIRWRSNVAEQRLSSREL